MEGVYEKQAELATRQSQLEADWKSFQGKSKLIPTETPPFVIVIILLTLALIAVIIVIIASSRQQCHDGEPLNQIQARSNTSKNEIPTSLLNSLTNPAALTQKPIASSSLQRIEASSPAEIVSVQFTLEPPTMTILGRGLSDPKSIDLEFFQTEARDPKDLPPKPESISWDVASSTVLISHDANMVARCMGVLPNDQQAENKGVWGLRIRNKMIGHADILFVAKDNSFSNHVHDYQNQLMFLQAEKVACKVQTKLTHAVLSLSQGFSIAQKTRFDVIFQDKSIQQLPSDTGALFLSLLKPGWYLVETTVKSNCVPMWIRAE